MHEVILSVGIDIGTSTTQLIFSQLTIENRASSYTVPRIDIVDKQVVYRSKIYFTPLRSPTEIDAEAVKRIIRDEYAAAGKTPADVRTGAVIITGDQIRAASCFLPLSENKSISMKLGTRHRAAIGLSEALRQTGQFPNPTP